jgi:hypothetical protein
VSLWGFRYGCRWGDLLVLVVLVVVLDGIAMGWSFKHRTLAVATHVAWILGSLFG